MDTRFIGRIGSVAAAIFCSGLLAGCGGTGFSDDAAQLEKAFALTASSPKASDPATYKTADTAALVKTLAGALRVGDLDTAAKVLHTLNTRGSGLSFDQYQAIRQALADVGHDLAQKAAKGDSHAKHLMNEMGP
jgi:hypothetical protein